MNPATLSMIDLSVTGCGKMTVWLACLCRDDSADILVNWKKNVTILLKMLNDKIAKKQKRKKISDSNILTILYEFSSLNYKFFSYFFHTGQCH